MLQHAKAKEQSVQSDANSTVNYPEHIVPYLVHALAHNSCPNVDECKDVEAYDNIYRYYVAHINTFWSPTAPIQIKQRLRRKRAIW